MLPGSLPSKASRSRVTCEQCDLMAELEVSLLGSLAVMRGQRVPTSVSVLVYPTQFKCLLLSGQWAQVPSPVQKAVLQGQRVLSALP